MTPETVDAEQPEAPEAPVEQVPVDGPPLVILLLGLVSVLASLVLLSADGLPAHAGGYVLACVVPILAVGLFRRFDLQRRTSAYYVPSSLPRPLIPAVLVLGLIAAVLHTWSIATSLAA